MERESEEGTADARDVDPERDQPPAGVGPPSMRPVAKAPAAARLPRPTAEQVADHYANHLTETSSSAFMYFTLAGVFRQADALAFKKFRDRLLADCGSPSDPVEIMLIEQLALAHPNTGRLPYKSATADGLEAARTYGALAIALAGEMRRTALAIKAYRIKPQAATVAVGAVVSAEGAGAVARAGEGGDDDELGSNAGDPEHDEGTIPLTESAAGRGRQAEPGEAARADRRRA